jgi:hypothetical protein
MERSDLPTNRQADASVEIDHLPPHGRPVFLVGAQRSGSTLLRLMLDAHPRVACPRHTEIEIAAIALAAVRGGRPDPERYRRRLLRSRRFRLHGNTIDPDLSFEDQVRGFLRQSAARAGTDWIGATVHRGFATLPSLWPEARFVYLVRDPRGVAASVLDVGWAANAWTAVDQWIRSEDAWARMRPHLRTDRYVEVRFEDLLADPERALSTICAMLGIEYSDDMLGYPRGSAYRPPDPAIAERWRSALSPHQAATVETRVGGSLLARGYAPTAPPRSWLPRSGPAARIHDLLERAAFRIRRYGLRLPLAILLASALRRPVRLDDLLDRLDDRRRTYGRDRHRIVRASVRGR